MKRSRRHAFSLIELVVVIAIVSMLAVLVAPEWERIKDRAQSVTCVSNLRQIGVGVLTYVGENDNTYPVIEPNPTNPVYTEDDGVTEQEAEPLLEALGPYGVEASVLKCPADLRGKNAGGRVYFNERGTSYQWRITVDGENATAPLVYGGRRGWGVRVAKPSRVTIATDFEGIHSGRLNRLYGDGHVSKPF
jgi:prepilin-type N-terminal cleavage/methylation domain-containing protein/prepilin-type processing-associated H-X9-DG protein